MSNANPFLTDLQIVSIVTAERIAPGGQIVETPIADCVRVWGRAGGRDVSSDVQKAIISEEPPIRIIPDPNGLDTQT